MGQQSIYYLARVCTNVARTVLFISQTSIIGVCIARYFQVKLWFVLYSA